MLIAVFVTKIVILHKYAYLLQLIFSACNGRAFRLSCNKKKIKSKTIYHWIKSRSCVIIGDKLNKGDTSPSVRSFHYYKL